MPDFFSGVKNCAEAILLRMISPAELFGYLALSHLLFMVAMLWSQRGRLEKPVGVPIFFACTVGGYLLVDASFWDAFPTLNLVFHLLPFWAPVAFWLFCKWIFDDGFRWQRWWYAVLLGVAVVFYAVFLQNKFRWFQLPPGLQMLSGLAAQLVSLFFVLLGILEVLRNRESDLVLRRVQFRKAFAICAAALMATTALAEVSLAGQTPPADLQLAQRMAITALTVVFAVFSLSVRPGFFPEKKPETDTGTLTDDPATPEVDPQLLENLRLVMVQKEMWRTEGLTIRQLAESLGVKEYRLRQAINGRLGFRNFNDYLHSYRIQKACELLSDPTKRALTVLEIAYETGYASLAPFNKAFRDLTGTTPTDWRKQHLGGV